MFTGEGDSSLTRSIGLWNDQPYATIRCNEFTDINTVAQAACNPWIAQVPVRGTDGLQFQPDLNEDDKISVFNPEIQRTLTYSFKSRNYDYDGLTTLIFECDGSTFLNYTANWENTVYNIQIDGTSNLTTITGSPAFASKGNFYMMPQIVADSLPLVVDQSGAPIVPN